MWAFPQSKLYQLFAPRPAAERASSQSHHQRIQALLESNRELRRANAELRAQIALLLGRARTDNIARPGLTGPCH